MKKILGIGNALVDVMTPVDNEKILEKFSLPKGSMTLVDARKSDLVRKETARFRSTLATGGSAANTIYGLSMLGARAGFIGSVGEDETGDFFENDFKKSGVSTFLLRRKTPTGTAVALITPDSERTFATHLGAAVELNSDDLDPAFFTGFNLLYLEGYLIYNRNLVTGACRMAKSRKMQIALDLASYNVVEENLSAFRDLVTEFADIVFANEEEAKAFTGFPPKKALSELSEMCDIAVVKTGKRGSLIKRGEEIIKVGVPSVRAIDSTGAGDMYSAGFLYGYSRGLALDKCGVIASLTAGKVIETIGARIREKDWASLKKNISLAVRSEDQVDI